MDNNTEKETKNETEKENSIISKYKNYTHKNPGKIAILEIYFIMSFICGLYMLRHKEEFVIHLPFENKITLGYGYNLFLPILIPISFVSSVISSIITSSIFQIKIN